MNDRATSIEKISPRMLRDALEAGGECHVIDVREAFEVEAESLRGALHAPLSSLDRHLGALKKEHPVYVLCRSGNRAGQAANRLQAAGYSQVKVIDGGIEAWKMAGFDVVRGMSSVWSLERQVRFTAGAIVLLGALSAYWIHPAWVLLSGGIGAGLMFSAATDTCGMGLVLSRMPWNQKKNERCLT